MAKFYVQSGGFRAIIDRSDSRQAAVDAFKRSGLDDCPELGILTLVFEKGFDSLEKTGTVLSTETILEECGLAELFSAHEVPDKTPTL